MNFDLTSADYARAGDCSPFFWEADGQSLWGAPRVVQSALLDRSLDLPRVGIVGVSAIRRRRRDSIGEGGRDYLTYAQGLSFRSRSVSFS